MEIYLFISCIIIPYFLLITKIREIIRQTFKKNYLLLSAGLVFFSLYPILFDILRFHLNLLEISARIAYVVVPFLLLLLKENKIKQTNIKRIIDLFIFIFLWIPVQTNILPGGKLKYTDIITMQTTLLETIPVVFYYFLIVSPINEEYTHFTFRFSRKDVFRILLSYILIIAIVMPLGLLIHFLIIKTSLDSILIIFLLLISLFFLIAIPEEFFFRVIMTNILRQDNFNNRIVLILVSSVVFGFAHITNPTPRWPVPNWAYVLFAAIAGSFYGWVYLKTKKFFASVLLHTLIDTTWFYFFT